MRYQGGKSRIAGQIAAKIRELHPTATEIWEPFCGGGAVTLALAKVGFRVYASDSHEDLILMWQALMRGEAEPFVDATEAEYQELRNAAPSARRGFVGFGASFGAAWFGGWARDSKGKRNFLREARENNQRLVGRAVTFYQGAYNQVTVRSASNFTDILVYADPPYVGTKPYKGFAPFDHNAFWAWAKGRRGPTFVSELVGPADLEVAWQQNINAHTSAQKFLRREERLYYKPATIPSHELADAAGVPGHDAPAHHADHGLLEHEQPAAGIPAQRAEGEPAAAGPGGAVDAREQHVTGREAPGTDH